MLQADPAPETTFGLGHSWQMPNAEYLPAVHSTQAVPLEFGSLAAAHATHALAPVPGVLVTWPAEHCAQCDEPATEYLPTSHAMQSDDAGPAAVDPLEYLPIAQSPEH